MSRFIVFEPSAEEAGPSDRIRLVRDGFAGWAVLFPFLWLFRHGLWLTGILTFLLWIGFGFLGEIPGLGLAAAVLPILLGILVALEGPSLRALRLKRKRFREAAVVEADTEEEAEILYYAGSESISVSRESSGDSRETTPPPFVGRAFGPSTHLLNVPRSQP